MGDPAVKIPPEISTVDIIGIHEAVIAIAADYAFPLLLETSLYALHTALTVHLVYRRWIDRKTTPFVNPLLFATLAMFALFSAYWSIDAYLLKAHAILVSHVVVLAFDPKAQILGHVQKTQSIAYTAHDVLGIAILILGDFISLWRAVHIMYGQQRWLYRLALCLGAAVFLIYVAMGILIIITAKHYLLLYVQIVTCMTNVLSTGFIAYKAWVHWKEVRQFVQRSGMSQGLAMLTMVVESGIVYVLTVFLCVVIISATHNVKTVKYYLIPLLAMYPTIVVVLVSTRRSVLEQSISMASSKKKNVRFAAPTRVQNRTLRALSSSDGLTSQGRSGRISLAVRRQH